MKKTYKAPLSKMVYIGQKAIMLDSSYGTLGSSEDPADYSTVLSKRRFGSFEIYEYDEEDM